MLVHLNERRLYVDQSLWCKNWRSSGVESWPGPDVQPSMTVAVQARCLEAKPIPRSNVAIRAVKSPKVKYWSELNRKYTRSAELYQRPEV